MNYGKASANWEKKSQHLLSESVKYRTYIDHLERAIRLRALRRGQKEVENMLEAADDGSSLFFLPTFLFGLDLIIGFAWFSRDNARRRAGPTRRATSVRPAALDRLAPQVGRDVRVWDRQRRVL